MTPRTALTRRELLRLSTGTLLAAGVWPGALFEDGTGSSSDFHFLVVNDVHYLNKDCGKWFGGVLKQMKGHAEKIDFCLLAGDLSEHGRPEQLAAMRDLLKTFGTPVHVVIGNHDYLTQTDRRAYEDLFPRRLNYQFDHRRWQFIGLDTTEGQNARNTTIHEDTLRWLDDTLPKLDKKRPTVVFTHFPIGPWVIGRPNNAAALLDRFKEYNLQAVYCGHLHAFTQRQLGWTILTTNKCCSGWHKNHDNSKEKGYFLCHAKDGMIKRTFMEVKPAWDWPVS
jgi:predicted phosphodiesterase